MSDRMRGFHGCGMTGPIVRIPRLWNGRCDRVDSTAVEWMFEIPQPWNRCSGFHIYEPACQQCCSAVSFREARTDRSYIHSGTNAAYRVCDGVAAAFVVASGSRESPSRCCKRPVTQGDVRRSARRCWRSASTCPESHRVARWTDTAGVINSGGQGHIRTHREWKAFGLPVLSVTD